MKMMEKVTQFKLLICLLMFAVVTAFTLHLTRSSLEDSHINIDKEEYSRIFDSQQFYLLSLQRENGAFVKWSGDRNNNQIVPYFSCFVGLSLLENPENAPAVRKYIDWHFEHLNLDDYNNLNYTIYDFKVEKGTEEPINKYDSTDSYAALFLMLLNKYYEVTADGDYLRNHKNQVLGVADAMISTLNNGLTYARPDYEIKYTMDNSEVYGGLCAIEQICRKVFEENNMEEHYSRIREEVGNAIETKLYDSETGFYCSSLNHFNRENFYPDGVCQLYPMIFGVLDPLSWRAKKLYREFNRNFYNWTEGRTDLFPWAIICYAAALQNDLRSVDAYLKNVKMNYIDQGHSYPWYSMEGAMTMLAVSTILKSL